MGVHRTTSPEILGVEVGSSVSRGVLLDVDSHEIAGVAEVPLGRGAFDGAGVIDPGVVAPSIEALLSELPVRDRSRVRVGLSIGPRNAGVGSGPTMLDWLEVQAAHLGQPLVRAGGLGVVFVPIRAVDHAVKTGFEIGLDLARVDLAPVAAVRAIGEQVDDLIFVGSGRGWQARMRDFEVLEAMETAQVSPDAPICVVRGDGAVRGITRYGWVDLSLALIRAGRVEVGRYAAAAGVALGVLYESPGNLLEGEVVSGRPPAPVAPPVEPVVPMAPVLERPPAESRPVQQEETLQLAVVDASLRAPVPAAATASPAGSGGPGALVADRAPEPAVEAGRVTHSPQVVVESERSPGAEVEVGVGVGAAGPDGADSVAGRLLQSSGPPAGRKRAGRQGSGLAIGSKIDDDHSWDEPRVDEDDPINLFSPDTDEAHILGRNGRFGLVHLLVLAIVVGAAFAAYWFLIA